MKILLATFLVFYSSTSPSCSASLSPCSSPAAALRLVFLSAKLCLSSAPPSKGCWKVSCQSLGPTAASPVIPPLQLLLQMLCLFLPHPVAKQTSGSLYPSEAALAPTAVSSKSPAHVVPSPAFCIDSGTIINIHTCRSECKVLLNKQLLVMKVLPLALFRACPDPFFLLLSKQVLVGNPISACRKLALNQRGGLVFSDLLPLCCHCLYEHCHVPLGSGLRAQRCLPQSCPECLSVAVRHQNKSGHCFILFFFINFFWVEEKKKKKMVTSSKLISQLIHQAL